MLSVFVLREAGRRWPRPSSSASREATLDSVSSVRRRGPLAASERQPPAGRSGEGQSPLAAEPSSPSSRPRCSWNLRRSRFRIDIHYRVVILPTRSLLSISHHTGRCQYAWGRPPASGARDAVWATRGWVQQGGTPSPWNDGEPGATGDGSSRGIDIKGAGIDTYENSASRSLRSAVRRCWLRVDCAMPISAATVSASVLRGQSK